MIIKPTTKKEKLGHIIRYKRKKCGYSQKALAKYVNYDQSIISRIEKGYESINDNLYLCVLDFFNIRHVENQKLENDLKEIMDSIYASYEVLNINHFRNYIFKIEPLLILNQDAILYYEIICLKLVCLYMLSQKKAETYLEELRDLYVVCHPKCQALYQMIDIHYYLWKHNRLDLSKKQKPISLDLNSDDGLIQYLWGKYYFKTFNYTKAIEYYTKALSHFIQEKNDQRIVRCGTSINEILLTDFQYDIVKTRSLELLQYKVDNEYDVRHLKFQLAYSLYHLSNFEEALPLFQKINTYTKNVFKQHLFHKCLFQLKISKKEDFIATDNYYDTLYFELEKDKNELYYHLIEDEILPRIDNVFYQKESQKYLFDLLDYYFINKKYKLFKSSSEKINKIMHI